MGICGSSPAYQGGYDSQQQQRMYNNQQYPQQQQQYNQYQNQQLATDPNDPALQQPQQLRCGSCQSLLSIPRWSQYARCPKCESTLEVPRPYSAYAQAQMQQQQPMYQQQQPMYQQQQPMYPPHPNNGYGGGQYGYAPVSNGGGMNSAMAIGGGLLGGLLLGDLIGGAMGGF